MPQESHEGGQEPTRRIALDFDGGRDVPPDEDHAEAGTPMHDAGTEAPTHDEPPTPERPAPETTRVTAFAPAPDTTDTSVPPRRIAMGVACLLLAGVVAVGVGAAIGQNVASSQLQEKPSSIETPETDRADSSDATDQGTTPVADDEGSDVAEATGDAVDDGSQPATDDTTTLPSTDDASKDQAATSGAQDGEAKDEKGKSESCDHEWEPYGVTTKVVAAKTHEEKVPAETKVVTEYHTVCNTCHETIDGHAAEHLEQTGHEGYTTNVPRKVTKVARKATTRTVVDTPAMKVSTWHQRRCKRCGEVKDLKAPKTKAEELKGSK